MKIKSIDPREYFSKYGFEDGDNEELNEVAAKVRPVAQEMLNKEFENRKLMYRAVICDVTTAHNSIRMLITWEEKGEKQYWDKNCGEERPAIEKVFKTIGRISSANAKWPKH